MKKTTGVLAAGLIVAAIGCGKKNEKKAPEAEPKVTVPETKVPEAPPEPVKATPEQIAKRVQECFGFFTSRNNDGFKTCFTADATLEIVGGESGKGTEEILKIAGAFQAGFSDLNVGNQITLINGTKVATADLLTGTHDGELMGMAATNKKIGMINGHVFEMDDINVAAKSERIYMDMATMMGQLGMSPAPHRAAMDKGADAPLIVIATGSETETANVESFKKALEALSAGDIAGHLAMIDDNVVFHDQSMPKDISGKKELEAMMKIWMKGFSEMKITPTNIWAAGDYVVVESVWSAKNTGALPEMGIKKATGKEINAHGMDIGRVENGKLVEMWTFMNGMEMATQLGLVPPPETK